MGSSSSEVHEMKKAKSMESSANIESVYSTTPKNMTEPRLSYKITTSINESLENDDDDDDHHYYRILQRRMHIILCYKKRSNNEDCDGLHIGGWLRQSLGSALGENPILAGRLRNSENGGLEIISNDGGLRCVEVQMPLDLVELLESKEKMNDVEDKLVYWQDIEKSNPQFSPLFYVQVTKFQCGGYSLGISCSLLLSDPSNMAKFLMRWEEIHRSMARENEVPRAHSSINYTVNFKNGFAGLEYDTIHNSSTNTTTSKSMIFTISTEDKSIHYSGDQIYKHFVLLCLKEAESKFGTKMTSNFTLITKEPSGDAKVELFSKEVNFDSSPKHLKYELNYISWEDLRINEVDFQRENGMVDASLHWTTCDALEGMIVVVISSPIKVYITVPSDQEIKS